MIDNRFDEKVGLLLFIIANFGLLDARIRELPFINIETILFFVMALIGMYLYINN